jgi:translation initiation factor IF-3
VLRFRDIRVIGAEGEQLGIMQSRQALNLARDQGLDLVMVSPTAQPPVCKIIDYGRHKYLTEKQNKESKKKQQEVKGIKISPRIAEHDMQHLIKKAAGFLEETHKVRVVCMFKAREITHPELGRKKLDYFADQVKEISVVERTPQLDGRQMIMVLNPKPNIGSKKNAKDQNQQNSGKAVQDNRKREDHAEEGVQQPPVPPQEQLAEETSGERADTV